jgi:hypothetical protein
MRRNRPPATARNRAADGGVFYLRASEDAVHGPVRFATRTGRGFCGRLMRRWCG